jgi:hypothetical protein
MKTMRELTNKELDAVGGGLLDFTFGAMSPIIKQIRISQTNWAGMVRQTGLVNLTAITQVNAAVAMIL